MQFRFSAALTVAILSLMSFSPVFAQTAAQADANTLSESQPSAEPEELSDTIEVTVKPETKVLFQGVDPVPVQFNLNGIKDIDPSLVSGVVANGVTRKVDAADQSIGQVKISSVSREDKEAALSGEGLNAQFVVTGESGLFPEKEIIVEGSRAELLAALQALNTQEEDEDKDDSAVQSDAVASNNSPSSSNDEAASYTTPSTPPTVPEDDPLVDKRATTEGCPMTFDYVNEVAIVNNKFQTFTDGVLTGEDACEPSGKTFKLHKSYLTEDNINLDTRLASAQFTWYYADDSGETHPVGETQIDAELVFPISEDESQCKIDVNYDTKQVIPMAELVYLNRNNKRTVARDCQPSEVSAPIPMMQTVEGCNLRNDFEKNLSFERAKWTYERGGLPYQAAPCADTGRSFPHSKVYAKNGIYVCEFKDFNGTSLIQQYRKEITVDGMPQYITACTPDTETTAVTATTNGCENPATWTHNIDAAVSYGQERHFFLNAEGAPVYINSCQDSEKTYSHNHEVTKFDYHDDKLFAYPLTTITIDTTNLIGKPYTIADNKLLDGAQQIVYALDGTTDVQNGERKDEGCYAYFLTDRSEKYLRPDNTVYYKPIGDGDRVGPEYVCTDANETASYYEVNVSGASTILGYKVAKTNVGNCGGSDEPHCSDVATQVGSVIPYKINILRTTRINPYTGATYVVDPVQTGKGLAVGFGPILSATVWSIPSNHGDVGVTPTGYKFSNPCSGSSYKITKTSGVAGWGNTYNYTAVCGFSPAEAIDW